VLIATHRHDLTGGPPGRRRARTDHGSALMLMPAAVLVMLVLGAITVDLAVVRLGQRELVAAAGDAANDAATVGLDEAVLRAGRGHVLDPGRAESAVLASLDAKGLLDRLASPPLVTITDDGTVEVRLARRVPHLFARALPGVEPDTLVRGTAAATLRAR
jgi:Flp pilus assembly protein TadG